MQVAAMATGKLESYSQSYQPRNSLLMFKFWTLDLNLYVWLSFPYLWIISVEFAN